MHALSTSPAPSSRPRFVPRLASLALTAVVLLTGLPAWSLDLQQAYESAQAHDATARAAAAAADAARERLPQARAQLLPNIAFSAGRNRNDLSREQSGVPIPEAPYYSFNQTLQLRQPIYRRPLMLALEQADHLVADADATLERERQNLGVRVTGAYLEALLAQDQFDLVLRQHAFTLAYLDAARKALAAGSGTRTEIDEAQARLDLNLAQQLEARQQLDYTRRQLESMTGQPAGELVPVDPQRLTLVAPQPAALEDWLLLAESGSPELLALKSRLEAARLEVGKAQGAHHPTLDALLQVTRSASENVTTPESSYLNRTVGLQLNLPLYAGGYASSVVRQAAAESLRAEETLEATRRDLGLRMQREFRGVTEGVLKVRALEQAVRSAEQLVKSSRRSFEAGSRSLLDVLNAEQQQQTALRDLAQARYLYLLSHVRLQALAGTDQAAAISQVNGWLVRP